MTNKLNNSFALKDGGYSNYEDTLSLARHRWYYYKEGFSPLLVDKAIELVGVNDNEFILDPFNGSGTTTLSAAIKGKKSIGIEVNPFTAFLSDAKLKSSSNASIDKAFEGIIKASKKKSNSDLIGFSTFSKTSEIEKWLFNKTVLNNFDAGWKTIKNIQSYDLRKITKLALIISAMDNCNAIKDGKCLRYRDGWQNNNFNRKSFLESLYNNFEIIKKDIEDAPLLSRATILNGDARRQLKSNSIEKFKLCITSPPYLNTFDYTDIYRPELFLGKFINDNEQLYNLRLKTVRSHIQAKWNNPLLKDFGLLYEQSIQHINAHKDQLMHKNIPLMVQAYFEDMFNILKLLKLKAQKDAELWLVVSNSAYANKEIPVDLIIGDLGSEAGWYLKEIGVLRHIRRRKTKHSPDINELRESVVIFSNSKK